MGAGNEIVDYSRAPCLRADQKTRGLWERDCTLFNYESRISAPPNLLHQLREKSVLDRELLLEPIEFPIHPF